MQLSTGLTFTGTFALTASATVAGGGEAFKIHSAEKPRINVVPTTPSAGTGNL
jgi:hypothetical protein